MMTEGWLLIAAISQSGHFAPDGMFFIIRASSVK